MLRCNRLSNVFIYHNKPVILRLNMKQACANQPKLPLYANILSYACLYLIKYICYVHNCYQSCKSVKYDDVCCLYMEEWSKFRILSHQVLLHHLNYYTSLSTQSHITWKKFELILSSSDSYDKELLALSRIRGPMPNCLPSAFPLL